MNFFKFVKIINILFNCRYVFKKPIKSKFLIFDIHNYHYFNKYIKKKQLTVLYSRNEEFNLFVLILNFLKFKFSKLDYYNTYINLVDPKFLISFKDNDHLFFLIKKKKNMKKILIQNGWKDPFFDKILNKRNFLKLRGFFNLDYFFSYNNSIGIKYKIMSGCEYISIGSFKSNIIKLTNSKKKLYDMMYISSFRAPKKKINKDFITKKISFEKFDKPQKELLKTLDKYSYKNKLKLYIYGKCVFKETIEMEKEYFASLLKNCKWEYIKNNYQKTFNYIDNSSLILTLNSSLGYEAFSRKIRVVFFDIRPKSDDLNASRFGWPSLKNKNNGPFWINSFNYRIVNKFLNNFRKFSDFKWEDIRKKYEKMLVVRDQDNRKFKKLIYKKS